MRISILILCLALLIAGCGRGYRSPADRDSPEQLELAGMAFDLSTKAESLLNEAPPAVSSSLSGFVETANRFSNAAQRFGGASLEARDAFDRLRYHAAQLQPVITREQYPELYQTWTEINEQMRTIGDRLGYKLGSETE